MAKLYFKYGSMGSGKSWDLLRSSFNYTERGQNVLLLSSSIDNRYGNNIIKSRTGLEMPCISIAEDTNILDLFIAENNKEKINCVFVDEVQFMKKHHIIEMSDIVDTYDIPVICYGLRSDYKMEMFEGSSYLMAICDEIQEIKSVCWCGKNANINVRINDGNIVYEGEQIMIGGNESYISLCRKHYKNNQLK